MLQRIIGEKHDLRARVGHDAPSVRIDRVELDQVLLNLVVNARDAMPGGGPITIAVDRRELPLDPVLGSNSDCVVLNVSDEGHGIPAEIQEEIFEPFFSTKAEHGTGLGLSICYGIVTAAGGDLRVYSEVGVGTTFTLILPAVDADRGPEASGTDEPAAVPTGTETILVVEDEEVVRRVTVRALEAQGYRVLEAADAEEALDLLEDRGARRRLDLLLTDVVLPGKSGPALVEEVRRVRPDLPVVLTSGYGEDLVRTQLVLDRASTVVIQKPFSVTELARKVRSLLDGPGGEPEAEPEPGRRGSRRPWPRGKKGRSHE